MKVKDLIKELSFFEDEVEKELYEYVSSFFDWGYSEVEE